MSEKYTYAVARIRALEVSLFSDAVIDQLIAKYGTAMAPQDANNAVKQEIGTVFSHVLENAGVFKQDKTGQDAFLRFVEGVGFHTV